VRSSRVVASISSTDAAACALMAAIARGFLRSNAKLTPNSATRWFRGGGGRGPGSLLDRGEEVGECRLVGCFECPLDRRRGRGLAEDPRADPLKLAHEDGPVRPECRRHLAGEGLLDGLECPVPLHDLRQGDDAFEEVAERSHADTSRR